MPRGRIERRTDFEIEPDEVLLDAANLPDFDESQFQGRIQKPIEKRAIISFGIGFSLLLLILIGEAFHLQVSQGSEYALQSERNRLEQEVLFATRGIVLDRNGESLITNTLEDEVFGERVYRAPGFAHLLGYVRYPQTDSAGFYFSTETEGVSGVEAIFDEKLNGENGVLLRERDARGEEHSSEAVVKAHAGDNITLSIDARLQESLHTHIQELADSIPFRGGAGVILDVETGELLALTNYPEYDPNVLAEGEDRDTVVSYQEDIRKPYLNRAVSGNFSPGSVVKPFVAVAALEEGFVSTDDVFLSTGQISIPNPYFPDQPTVFRDWKAHGYVDVVKALAVSSNIFFYIVGGGFEGHPGLGINALSKWYEYFGLGEVTGSEYASEEDGFVPTPQWKKDTFNEDWRIGDTYYTAIGQYALQATPLQIARGIAAIANGGWLVETTLVRGTQGARERVPFSKETQEVVIAGMRDAVEDQEVGTARGLYNQHVSIAAKTGTAQVGVDKSLHNAWVVGFWPLEKPKYAFAVVMERGPSTNLIGAVSVMRNVVEDIAISAPEYFTVDAE